MARKMILRACPRVAPLGWPCEIREPVRGQSSVLYQWVVVKPDGTGWTTGAIHDNVDHAFPENKLEEVLESFYEYAGPWPFDFAVTVVETPPTKKRATKPFTNTGRARKKRRAT